MAKVRKQVRVASNPQRHAKKANSGKKSGGRRRKSNPISGHRRRRRNPTFGGAIGSPKELVTSAVAGLAAAVATRQLPQLILTTNNTGWQGYAANAVTALACTWAASAFLGPTAAKAALVGGSVILLDRVLTEQVSPIGQYLSLSGVGDATAMTKLGTVRDGWFLHPTMVDGNNQMVIPDPVTAAAVNAVMQKFPGISQQQAMNVIAQGGGAPATLARMGAVNPDVMRRHAASGQLLSSRFAGRFQQN